MKELWLTRLLLSDHTIRTLAKRLGDRSDSKSQLQGLDPYNWHRLSWDAFPERDGVARDFLTRLDEQAGRARLLILSPMAPTAPKWLNDGDDWASKAIPPEFFVARRYRFQLHANPTVKRVVRNAAGQKKKNGRREPIKDPAEISAWLARKGKTAGFEIVPSSLDIQSAPTRFQKGGSSGTHNAVDIEGVLHVTDPSLFYNEALFKGIGSAKAFGFGMLCLSPI